MQINITGHHVHATPAIKAFTEEKFDRLTHRGDKIISINVVFNIEQNNQIAEATVHVPGAELHARAVSSDLYAAIDELVDKLDRQIKKHREKMTDHRGKE